MGKNAAKKTDGTPQSEVETGDNNETGESVLTSAVEGSETTSATAPMDMAAYESVVAERDALRARVDALEEEILGDDGDEIEANIPDTGNAYPAPQGMHAVISQAASHRLTGPQDAHFALHTIELLMGRLKTALPAAIQASESPELTRYLETILSTL